MKSVKLIFQNLILSGFNSRNQLNQNESRISFSNVAEDFFEFVTVMRDITLCKLIPLSCILTPPISFTPFQHNCTHQKQC